MSHHFIYERCILRFLNKSRKLEPLSCLYNRKYVTRKERRKKSPLCDTGNEKNGTGHCEKRSLYISLLT